MKEITTITDLIDHLIKLVSAYRKSYRFCEKADKTIQIISGIVGSSAVLALIPAVPIFIVGVGVIPAVTGVLSNVLKLKEKQTRLKIYHRQFKQLLSFARTQISKNDTETITHVFNKILKIQKSETYVEPFEKYLKKYKLNGYNQKVKFSDSVIITKDSPL